MWHATVEGHGTTAQGRNTLPGARATPMRRAGAAPHNAANNVTSTPARTSKLDRILIMVREPTRLGHEPMSFDLPTSWRPRGAEACGRSYGARTRREGAVGGRAPGPHVCMGERSYEVPTTARSKAAARRGREQPSAKPRHGAPNLLEARRWRGHERPGAWTSHAPGRNCVEPRRLVRRPGLLAPQEDVHAVLDAWQLPLVGKAELQGLPELCHHGADLRPRALGLGLETSGGPTLPRRQGASSVATGVARLLRVWLRIVINVPIRRIPVRGASG